MDTKKQPNEAEKFKLDKGVRNAPLIGQVICTECHHRHYENERVVKKGVIWSTNHCPKCNCISIYL